MTIQSKAIDIARKEVGYVEGPKRNQSKYAADLFPSVDFQPWCGSFVGWVYDAAGFALGKVVWAPSTRMTEAWARRKGFWKTSGPKLGDIVIYGFGKSHAVHMGISWPDPKASGYRAIEGNTSPGSAGSQRNGGGVYVRYRGRKSIRGWVDMEKVLKHYGVAQAVAEIEAEQAGADGALVVDGVCGDDTAREMQERLKKHDPTLKVDGKIGPHTIKVWQKHEGTPVDGVISGQNSFCRSKMPAVRRDCISDGNNGSTLIRRVQENLNKGGAGLVVDGKAGEAFWKAMQKALNEDASALL